MFRTLLDTYIERFKHDPESTTPCTTLCGKIQKCLNGIQTAYMPENARLHVSMATWQ